MQGGCSSGCVWHHQTCSSSLRQAADAERRKHFSDFPTLSGGSGAFGFTWWTGKWPPLTHRVPTGAPIPPNRAEPLQPADVDWRPVRCVLQSAAHPKTKRASQGLNRYWKKSFCAQTGEKSVRKIQNITSHLSCLPQNILVCLTAQ